MTMEVVGAASSVIAVVELSAKVANVLFEYFTAVKNARPDIERLQGELVRLNTTLKGAHKLLESPNGAQLETSQGLRQGLHGCSSELARFEKKLGEKLKSGSSRRMSRFGIRALKWPLESKDVDHIIATLERERDTLSAALTIDQAYVSTF
jgi:uncharacterized protein YaaN involved in tellurite resistance